MQYPHDAQSYNRYSYVLNNPLSNTDPSGYFLRKLFKRLGSALRQIIPSVLSIAITATPLGPIFGGFVAGFIFGGGSLEAGVTGMISGAMFAGLHGLKYGPGKLLGHGIAGGISNTMRGGSFRAGFFAGGFTQFVSWQQALGNVDIFSSDIGSTIGRMQNAFAAAIVGGTASVIGGGKFANGAMTGAFSRMFNDFYATPKTGESISDYEKRINEEYDDKIRKLHEKYDSYYKDAIKVALDVAPGTKTGWEVKKGIVTFEGRDISIGVSAGYDGVEASAKIMVIQAIRNITPIKEPLRAIGVGRYERQRQICLLERNC